MVGFGLVPCFYLSVELSLSEGWLVGQEWQESIIWLSEGVMRPCPHDSIRKLWAHDIWHPLF